VNEHPNFILTVMHPPAFTPKLLHMINYSSPTHFLTESELTTLCVILTKCCSAVLKSVYHIEGNIHGVQISFFSFSVYQNEMKCTRVFICKMDRTKIKHTNQQKIAQNQIWTPRKVSCYTVICLVWELYKTSITRKVNSLEGLSAIYSLNSFPMIAGCHTMATDDLLNLTSERKAGRPMRS